MNNKESENSEHTSETRASNSTYELFILAVTIVSLLGVTAWLFLSERVTHKEALHRIDILFSAVFFVDFLRSLYRAPDRKTYLKWGWLDLMGSVPAHPLFRLARLRRAGQAFHVLRNKNTSELARDTRENLPQSAFLVTLLVAILVISIGSLAVLEFESHTPDANIISGTDAVWWAFVTVTTVGYGDRVPVTGTARLLAMFMMLVGIGIFGVLTSYLAHWFVSAGEKAIEADIATMKADNITMKDDITTAKNCLGALQTELVAIKQLLQEQNRSSIESESEAGGEEN